MSLDDKKERRVFDQVDGVKSVDSSPVEFGKHVRELDQFYNESDTEIKRYLRKLLMERIEEGKKVLEQDKVTQHEGDIVMDNIAHYSSLFDEWKEEIK